ncbi:YihY/virulence factor BrkB family protein [Paracoccus caeni]|uniref:YihY/virulence factor BrkB family protein n=1 Tax=Paracoccus caeni TaxID=657651 RepID=A0A934SIX7_9RHOB|nr:YihY/virulence factor BrkB family protein [Paracoccus caeni]MBK4215293.1 YihY/virulence factor BrkB family protein [Paracoccus caeni]
MTTQETPPKSVWNSLTGELDDAERDRFGLGETSAKPQASAPSGRMRDMGGRDLLEIGKETVSRIGSDRVTAVAGGITFFALLSLFPAMTAFVSIYGLVSDPATIAQHVQLLENIVPPDGLAIIGNQLTAITSSSGSALSLAGIAGLLMAFYSANGGMKALLSALNVAFYQSETRSFLRLNLVAMMFTLGGLIMVMAMLLVIAVLPAVLLWLPLPDATSNLLRFVRWPIMFFVLIVGLAAIYRWGPAAPESRWRWISPGAVIAAVALVAASILFSWYAANFANYNKTYGSLGAVIALMMWLWLSAMIVLTGAEINAGIDRHLRRKQGLPDRVKLA